MPCFIGHYRFHCSCNISMTQCKTAVTPLLTHWSYCSLALSHRYSHVPRSNSMWMLKASLFIYKKNFYWNNFMYIVNTHSLCKISIQTDNENYLFKILYRQWDIFKILFCSQSRINPSCLRHEKFLAKWASPKPSHGLSLGAPFYQHRLPLISVWIFY